MTATQSIREALKPASTHELKSGKFIAVSDAATKVGVTPATILNRVKRGNYVGRTFQGRLVLVDVSEFHATGTVNNG